MSTCFTILCTFIISDWCGTGKQSKDACTLLPADRVSYSIGKRVGYIGNANNLLLNFQSK